MSSTSESSLISAGRRPSHQFRVSGGTASMLSLSRQDTLSLMEASGGFHAKYEPKEVLGKYVRLRLAETAGKTAGMSV